MVPGEAPKVEEELQETPWLQIDNVFYEARTFSHGGPRLALDAAGVPLGDYIFRFDFGLVAIEVCEDAWSPDGPMRRRCYSGAELVVNVSSSPYRMGIDATRREMLATRSADSQTVLLYANAVGGQDGLVYDGGGFCFQNGRRVFEAPRFVTHSFPGSFEPHPYHPGRLDLERGVGAATGGALAALGHRIEWLPDLSIGTAGVCAIVADRETGVLYGGADPRRAARAMGW